MANATDQVIEIKFALRDEISAQVRKTVAEVLRLNELRTDKAREHLGLMGQAAQKVGRELRSLAMLSGVGGILGAGGVIAGLAAASRSLSQFAQTGIRSHYTAQQLGISVDALERYTDGLRVLGESEQEAQSGISHAMETLEEAFHKGTQSRLFEELSRGVRGTGVQLYNELMRTYRTEGPERALQLLITRLRGMSRETQAHFSRFLGFGNLAVADLARILPRLRPLIHLNRDQLVDYNLANINLQRSWENIKTTIGIALLPAFKDLYAAIDKYLQSESGAKLVERVMGWIAALTEWVSSGGFGKQLEAIGAGAAKIVDDLSSAFAAADAVVQAMGIGWPRVFEALVATRIVAFLFGMGTALSKIAPYAAVITALVTLLTRKEEIREELRKQREQTLKEHPEAPRGGPEALPGLIWDILKDIFKGNIDLWGKGPQKQGALEPPAGGIQLGDLALDRAAKRDLTNQFASLDYELEKLNAYLLPGGPEGKAGRSGYQLPTTGATPLPPRKGSILSGVTEGWGLGSWFANFAGRYNWVDPMDKPGSNGLDVPESKQGIALASTETLGQWFLLTTPTGEQYKVRQTDVGPGIRTQKIVDVSAAQAEKMGYTPKTFPTGMKGRPNQPLFHVEPTTLSLSEVLWRQRLDAGHPAPHSFAPRTSWDTDELASLTRPRSLIAGTGADGGPLEGSATVDIDVSSSKSADRSSGSNLFTPHIIEYTPQMAKTGSDRAAPSLFNSQ
jgi:hypothetical protein